LFAWNIATFFRDKMLNIVSKAV